MPTAIATSLSLHSANRQSKSEFLVSGRQIKMREALNALVIDDDSEDVAMIVGALEEDRNIAKIVTMTSGEDVIALLDEGSFRPDIIFLDLNMPKMNGFDVLDAIRSRDLLANLPIVILTTSHHSADMRASFQGLASSYVVKPVSHAILKAKLEQISNCVMKGEFLDKCI